ncbi:hypothetical protein AB595_16625 [Massilia sp. WF1]|uniref:hypothetical protein n=1 Tax=unclassified Massilia TaxID=2609279 RepID=UPI00064A8987|nr:MULTISPECIES: hypothetical protein [unclassified Massilia]ALK95401.1 hypothetical protein AM586_02920 [Massilia sp. WG5]KLU35715.1 hypothetical protein AB595_16625 [Massilia sp. WF1]
METRKQGAAKRLILSLAAGVGLSGCVYAPPYAAPYSAYGYSAYDTAPGYYQPYSYGYPTYVGPPLSLSFGFYEHDYHGGRGWGGYRGGWRGRH